MVDSVTVTCFTPTRLCYLTVPIRHSRLQLGQHLVKCPTPFSKEVTCLDAGPGPSDTKGGQGIHNLDQNLNECVSHVVKQCMETDGDSKVAIKSYRTRCTLSNA